MKITEKHFHKDLNIKDGKLELNVRDLSWFKSDLASMGEAARLKHGDLSPDRLIKVIVLDTETTGLEDNDEVIELCMADIYLVRDTYEFYKMGEITDELREPKAESKKVLNEMIIELTGLTSEMIKGQVIDNEKVITRLMSADLIIAHNAQFDRRQLINMMSTSKDHVEKLSKKIWGCSYQFVPWKEMGFMNSKQEILLVFHGVVFEGHRADTDVAALTWVLSKFNYFPNIIKEVKDKKILVSAIGSPFSAKDLLSKKHHFKFDGDYKVWRGVLRLEDFEKNKEELIKDAYEGKPSKLHLVELKPCQLLASNQEILDSVVK